MGDEFLSFKLYKFIRSIYTIDLAPDERVKLKNPKFTQQLKEEGHVSEETRKVWRRVVKNDVRKRTKYKITIKGLERCVWLSITNGLNRSEITFII